MRSFHSLLFACALAAGALAGLLTACGDDDTEADRLGVGAQCTANDQCDEDTSQLCLTQFKGGYCGIQGCTKDADCPEASACVAHTDGMNYCFRTCLDKLECNENRDLENESNCSSSVEFVDGMKTLKACVPPSGT
jgi:hypothetical protein